MADKYEVCKACKYKIYFKAPDTKAGKCPNCGGTGRVYVSKPDEPIKAEITLKDINDNLITVISILDSIFIYLRDN